MQVGNLVGFYSQNQYGTDRHASKKKKKYSKDTKYSNAKIFSNRFQQYSVVKCIEEASNETDISQLKRSDASTDAAKAKKSSEERT